MAAGPITRTCSLGLALLIAAPAFAQVPDAIAYVRARAADAAGLPASASAGYSAALAADPDDAILAMRAYRQALAAGDYALAGRAAAALERSGSAPPDAALLGLAVALKGGDRAGMDAALSRIASGPLAFLSPVLEAWIAAGRGGDPLPALDKARGNLLATRFAAGHRPLLLAGRGSGKAASGVSRAFVDLAGDIAAERIAPLSIALTRAALLLDPTDDRARLYLGEALSQSGAHALALAELGKVSPASPYRRGAQVEVIAALRRAGRDGEALPLAKAMADGKDASAADARTYGELLSAGAQYSAAADAFAVALGRPGGEGWELHYLQGAALDRAGRWQAALASLKLAVELGPDQAPALQYLGNAQILRGENLAEAQALLERANKLQPGDSGISASLGWAYYVRGDVARALPLLESAVQGDPGGATGNEHLGDAYWRLGRRYEARYAWNMAAVYAAPDADRRIKNKLANGL